MREKPILTPTEKRLFLSLAKLGEAQTGQLSKESKIATSNIYSLLDSLVKKGLVNYKIKNNIKIFFPSKKESVERLYEDRQKELEEEKKQFIESLLEVNKISEEDRKENHKYFEGIKGVKSMWDEINSLIDNNSLIKIHTSSKKGYNNLIGFYNEHQKRIKQKNAEEKMIFPLEDKALAKTRKKNKKIKVKFMDLKNEAEWGVIEDYFFIQYIITKNPRSFLIKDEIISKTFEQVFDNLWKHAKS